MSETIDLEKKRRFFETYVTVYQSPSIVTWEGFEAASWRRTPY